MSTRFTYSALLFVSILSVGSFATLQKGDKCSLKDGNEGECKIMKECPIAVELIKIGVFPVICGLEGTKSIVCCSDGVEDIILLINKARSRIPGRVSRKKCKEYAEYAYEKIPTPTLLLYPHFNKNLLCDIPRNRLLIGSSVASRREFPHMALLGHKPDNKVVWRCAGSLISENFVLTAARCLFSLNVGPVTMVRVGFTNRSDSMYIQERTVSEIIPYPEYDYPNKYHDIGLVRLSENVAFNTYVRPACLQTGKYIPYISAVASGWGVITFVEEPNDNLLATVLDISSVDTCNNTYKRFISPTDILKNGIIDDLMICAKISSLPLSTTCQGDAGGPLQVYHEETKDVKCMYDIIGVTSFGRSCGVMKTLPDVFTRVSAYVKWIEDIVWPN